MGYYSTAYFGMCVKKDKINELNKIIKEYNNKPEQDEDLFKDYFFYNLKINKEGYFDYPDYYNKWYENYDFALFIKDYVEEGKLEFIGEDGEEWGYEFDGKGNVYDLEYTTKRGKKLN